jgi:hypothetical protein
MQKPRIHKDVENTPSANIPSATTAPPTENADEPYVASGGDYDKPNKAFETSSYTAYGTSLRPS